MEFRPRICLNLLLVLALGFTSAACTPKPSAKAIRQAGRGASAARLIGRDAVAVGGVVLAADIKPWLFPADETDLATQLQLLLQQALPKAKVVPCAVVSDQADPARLAEALADYARAGQLAAPAVRQFGVSLQAARRLLLMRLSDDGLWYAAPNFRLARSPNGSVATVPLGLPAGQPVSAQRKVTGTLDLLDLDSGRCLWSTRVTLPVEFTLQSLERSGGVAVSLPRVDSKVATAPRLVAVPDERTEAAMSRLLRTLVGDMDPARLWPWQRSHKTGGTPDPLR
jgi:hypothetical protein